MSPDDRRVAGDIQGACRLIASFVASRSFFDFQASDMSRSAVAYQFVIIGEATKKLSRQFRDQHALLPWRAMAGMRDLLVHEYRKVDFLVVWSSATRDVPRLDAILSGMLDGV